MDKIFQIDFKKLAEILLPYRLRKQAVLAFLYAMVLPVKTLHMLFSGNRSNNLYRLLITPQVCYLEKFLNDRYDYALRRIRVRDAQYAGLLYMYMEAEGNPVFMFTEAEGKPVYLFTEAETLAQEDNFEVVLPAGMDYGENQMRGEIDSYKLAGMKYQIKIEK
jgi:hypothetical protein